MCHLATTQGRAPRYITALCAEVVDQAALIGSGSCLTAVTRFRIAASSTARKPTETCASTEGEASIPWLLRFSGT